MSSIYVPAHVVLLLRRIANVIGTLSISNQYLMMRSRPEAADHDQASGISIPWLGGKWSWPWSSLSTGTEQPAGMLPDDPPPPTPHHSDDRRSRPHQPLPVVDKRDHMQTTPPDIIHQLLANSALYDPLRTPRFPIVLCHGLYGFDVRGPSSFPSLRMHYWSNVLSILRDKVGADVIVTSVPGTGSIASRAETLDRQLQLKACGRGINLLAHSMGGLDCRYLISYVKPTEYVPLSLTTVSTPHRGSPFMDWCAEYIGIGKPRTMGDKDGDASSSTLHTQTRAHGQTQIAASSAPSPSAFPLSLSLSSLPSSFTTLLLSIVDSPAYANLTTSYLTDVFNPSTLDDPRVKYFSVAGRVGGVSIWHPFWLPKMVIDGWEEKERARMKASREGGGQSGLWENEREWGNDGLVTVQSAKWGEFLGIMEGCDHWEMRGARGVDLASIGISGDSWGMRALDWGWAWRREERAHRERERQGVSTGEGMSGKDRDTAAHDQDDAVVQSSTDKLSAVFDWLVEQVPMRSGVSHKGREVGDSKRMKRTRNELSTRSDLERFYVALSRKMYDEGL